MSRGKKHPRRSPAADGVLASDSGSVSVRSPRTIRGLLTAITIGGGFVGGALGAAMGYYVFGWLNREHGIYAIVLPAVLLGLGCGLGMRRRVPAMGFVCGVAACVFSLLIEWQYFPLAEDESLRYFLTHLNEKPPIRLGLIAFGSLLASWFGSGRDD